MTSTRKDQRKSINLRAAETQGTEMTAVSTLYKAVAVPLHLALVLAVPAVPAVLAQVDQRV
jgi:hypothetical protein